MSVAQIAGIMGAKNTWIIPMRHPISLTGVEMEALTAAAVAALTVYDRCKAADKGMMICLTNAQWWGWVQENPQDL